MKKDKDWLSEQVGDLNSTDAVFNESGVSYIDTAVSIEEVYDLIYQLDEPEVLSPEVNIDVILDDLKEFVKEQQSLSQNVGMAHTPAGNDTHYRQYDYVLECIKEYEPSDELKELVPKQELPVIPKFVADWIEDLKSKKINLLENIYEFTQGEDIHDYMREQSNVLMRAWLDGFTVESERKYYAKIKGHELLSDRKDSYWNVDRKELYIDNIWHDCSGYKTTKLTKYDWNNLGINEDNADFVKAEEVAE